MLQSGVLLLSYYMFNLYLLTVNCLAQWCAWSTVTCEASIYKFMCSSMKHRVCGCPEPSDKGNNTDFCKMLPLKLNRNGFTYLGGDSNKCIKFTLCPHTPANDTPPWCGWSFWSQWSLTCGAGHRLRQRVCKCGTNNRPKSLCGGKKWETQSKSRKGTTCPTVPGWCEWSEWAYSCDCYTPAHNDRTRKCKCPYVNGASCIGNYKEWCTKPSYCDMDNDENDTNTQNVSNYKWFVIITAIIGIILLFVCLATRNKSKSDTRIEEEEVISLQEQTTPDSNKILSTYTAIANPGNPVTQELDYQLLPPSNDANQEVAA